MLTPAHKSHNRDKHKLSCWSFGREHFVLLFLIAQTYNCSCEWLCDYRGNSSASWASCLPYCAVVDSNRNRWGLPGGGRRTAEQNQIGAATQRTCIQWKLGVGLPLPGSPHVSQFRRSAWWFLRLHLGTHSKFFKVTTSWSSLREGQGFAALSTKQRAATVRNLKYETYLELFQTFLFTT